MDQANDSVQENVTISTDATTTRVPQNSKTKTKVNISRLNREALEKDANKKLRKTRHPKIVGKKVDIYDMSSPKRGNCLIICNNKFAHEKAMPQLPGYIRDAAILEDLFQSLFFDCYLFNDQTSADILKQIEFYANKRDPEHVTNAFVVVILTHGDKHNLYGRNHNPGILEDKLTKSEIKAILNHENCKHLKDKPKLCFLQCCRGSDDDLGIIDSLSPEFNEDHGLDLDNKANKEWVITETQQQLLDSFKAEAANAVSNEETVEVKDIIAGKDRKAKRIRPTLSVMMICHATTHGYKSYVPLCGSIFVQAVVGIFKKFAHNQDFQMLLNKSSDRMWNVDIPIGNGLVKQTMACSVIGWRKRLFFNPGYAATKKQPMIESVDAIPSSSTTTETATEIATKPSIKTPTKITMSILPKNPSVKVPLSNLNIQPEEPPVKVRRKSKGTGQPNRNNSSQSILKNLRFGVASIVVNGKVTYLNGYVRTRAKNPKTQAQANCELCNLNEIEDLYHIMTTCPHYKAPRNTFLASCPGWQRVSRDNFPWKLCNYGKSKAHKPEHLYNFWITALKIRKFYYLVSRFCKKLPPSPKKKCNKVRLWSPNTLSEILKMTRRQEMNNRHT